MSSNESVVMEGGHGDMRTHSPYLLTIMKWCVSSLWSTATVFLHKLMKTQILQITAGKTRMAGKDHLDPEPKVECVILHEPDSPTLDVIFVHGLYGSLGNTWRQGEWRNKYKINPNVVELRNHPTKLSCSCDKPKSNVQNNLNKCKLNDILSYETDMNEREPININERLKRILPNENLLITENFYNNELLNEEISGNYKTQAKFVQDLFNRKVYEEMKCDDDNKCEYYNECECKVNERCVAGCGCVCDVCYSTCWPRDWIKMDFPGARVISINYTSDPYLWRPLWVKGNKRLRLHERAEQMISQLLSMGVGQRPIIWVGHSKGGLFIKQIYCEAFEAHLKVSKTSKNNNDNEYNFEMNQNVERNTILHDVIFKIHDETDYKNYFIKDNVIINDKNTFIMKTNNEINKICDNYNNIELNNGLNEEILKVERKKVYRNMLEVNEFGIEEEECLKGRASLWKSSAGFMFYSVPHRGSPLADIKTPITSRSIELLEISKDCRLVLSLHDRWLMASSPTKPIVRSVVETCRTLMSVLWLRIVSVDSADAGIGLLCGVSVDHREICKPSSRSCLLYTQLTELIHTALNKCDCL